MKSTDSTVQASNSLLFSFTSMVGLTGLLGLIMNKEQAPHNDSAPEDTELKKQEKTVTETKLTEREEEDFVLLTMHETTSASVKLASKAKNTNNKKTKANTQECMNSNYDDYDPSSEKEINRNRNRRSRYLGPTDI